MVAVACSYPAALVYYTTSNPRSPPPPWANSEFLRTGDLCRVDAEGLLYVEGRLKDLVIVAGRNVYPQVNNVEVMNLYVHSALVCRSMTLVPVDLLFMHSNARSKHGLSFGNPWRSYERQMISPHFFANVSRPAPDFGYHPEPLLYAQDVEFVAQDASPLVRPGCIAVFSETELGGGLEVSFSLFTRRVRAPTWVLCSPPSRSAYHSSCSLHHIAVAGINGKSKGQGTFRLVGAEWPLIRAPT